MELEQVQHKLRVMRLAVALMQFQLEAFKRYARTGTLIPMPECERKAVEFLAIGDQVEVLT